MIQAPLIQPIFGDSSPYSLATSPPAYITVALEALRHADEKSALLKAAESVLTRYLEPFMVGATQAQ